MIDSEGAIQQANHYYPFGGMFAETNPADQPYKFGGKEFDEENGLDLYDFHARQMEPMLGRFTTMDPLAEKYYAMSPYGYTGNNPMRFVDPTGMDWYEDDDGNKMWRKTSDEIYTDDSGKEWKNSGTKYLHVGKNSALLFEQETNENGELYLKTTDNKKSILNYLEGIKETKIVEKINWNEGLPNEFEALEKVFVVSANANKYIDLNDDSLREQYKNKLNNKNLEYRYSPLGMQVSGKTAMFLDLLFQLAIPIPSLPKKNESLKTKIDNIQLKKTIDEYRRLGVIKQLIMIVYLILGILGLSIYLFYENRKR